ncbi:MAG: hypothetical protein ABI234_15770 [Ktedonobacteraceae bacterium]
MESSTERNVAPSSLTLMGHARRPDNDHCPLEMRCHQPNADWMLSAPLAIGDVSGGKS